jgi:hypothetical protein
MDLKVVTREELLAARQRVLARGQGLRDGLSGTVIRGRVRSARWQPLQRGVYALSGGEADRATRMWAALLRAGPGAVFSHHSAAEIHGLLREPCPVIHITVPAERNPARRGKIPGVVIHRSSLLERARHPASSVPCTRLEETVLDLVQASASADERFEWICRAIGERLTTAERLRRALRERSRFPGRRAAELALGYAREGIMSWLELQWVTGVERPHGLPAARRQVRVRQETRTRYLDNLYEPYLVCVELDGQAAHPGHEQWRDSARDRWNLVRGKIVTMRFRTADLDSREGRCEAAAQLASVLADRAPAAGADVTDGIAAVRPCGPRCPVRRERRGDDSAL